jgi:AcrR family transcriptional regulator
MSRRDRERAFRAQLILESAETVFAEHGFQGAAVEEIAARSEVAIATLYKMFGSKEEIFAALIEYRQEEFIVSIRGAALTGGSPLEQLDRLLRAVFEYFDLHKTAFRIYLTATHGFPGLIRSSLGERTFTKYQEFVSLFASIIEAGMQKRAWSVDDPPRVAVASVGALNALLVRRHMGDDDADLDDDVRQATSLIRRLVGAQVADCEKPAKR